MKGVRQKIQGKEELVRSKMQGHVAEFVSRQPIGPDPTLEFGEARMPTSLMRDQTIPEKVYGGNQVELTKLLRLGLVLAVVPTSGPKKGLRVPVTEDNRNTIALEIGDEVHRRMRNGDLVLNNRYPSIQMYSILGATAIAGFQENLGIHMAVTKAYNADFDGDEMQTHIPQTSGAMADVYASVHARRNMINVQSSRPLFGGVYDVPVATTLLSNPNTVVSELHFFNVITRLKRNEQLFTLFSRMERFGKAISRPLPPGNALSSLIEVYMNFINSLPSGQDRFINSLSAQTAFMIWLRENNLLMGAPVANVKLERYRQADPGKIDGLLVSSYFSNIADFVKGSARNWELFERDSKEASLPYTFQTYEEAYEAYLPYLAYRDNKRKTTYGAFVKDILPSTNLDKYRKNVPLDEFINEIAPKYNDSDSVFKIFIINNLNAVAITNTETIIVDNAATTRAVVALFRKTYPEAELSDDEILEQVERVLSIINQKTSSPIPIREFASEMRDRLNKKLQESLSWSKSETKRASRVLDEDEATERKAEADKREIRIRESINLLFKDLEELEKNNPDERVWLNYSLNNTEVVQHNEYFGTTLLSSILPAGLEYFEYRGFHKIRSSSIWNLDYGCGRNFS